MAKISTNLKQWCPKCLQITGTWYDEINTAHCAGCDKKPRRKPKAVDHKGAMF